jgi:hypothetical protein
MFVDAAKILAQQKRRQDGELDLRSVPRTWRPPKHVLVVSTSTNLFKTEKEAHEWIKSQSSDKHVQHLTYVFDV